MQTFRPATPGHGAPGKLVNNYNLVILNDVINVPLNKLVRPESRIQVMHQREIRGIVQTFSSPQEACLGQQIFYTLVTILCEEDLLVLFVDAEIARPLFFLLLNKFRNQAIDCYI